MKFIWKNNKVKIMGILNVTPDSFSDGNLFFKKEDTFKHIDYMIKNKVDILDIGGQSTRPNYIEVSEKEELDRILNAVIYAKKKKVFISIDTYSTFVAKNILKYKIDIINDVNGLDTPGMIELLKNYPKVKIVIMHSRIRDKNKNLIDDIKEFYKEKIKQCIYHNIKLDRICFDPGIGFNKNFLENLQILKYPKKFKYKDFPLLIGISRKSIISHIIKENNPLNRDFGTIIANSHFIFNNVNIIRTHNVKAMKDAISLWKILKYIN